MKLFNDFVEVIITLEVGPRIISYRPVQGRSVFKLVREEAGKSKEDVWKIRGGHRLWTAPEDFGKEDSLCYALDNSEVNHSIEDEFTIRVANLIEGPAKIRREMVVRLEKRLRTARMGRAVGKIEEQVSIDRQGHPRFELLN